LFTGSLALDLREATIYYTVYGDDVARQDSAMALESAKGVLRSTVGKQTGVKFTPSLTFVADHVPEHAASIDHLLEAARAEDARVQELASASAPAGEADPYKPPRRTEDADET
jgi:ribosome-binding factor A